MKFAMNAKTQIRQFERNEELLTWKKYFLEICNFLKKYVIILLSEAMLIICNIG